MKTTTVRAARDTRAFTLVEMLVVVTIIAVLASLVAAQVTRSLRMANETKTRTMTVELKNGIDNYRVEYDRYPLEPGAATQAGEDMAELLTDGKNRIVDTLLGVPADPGSGPDLNPLRIQYANLPTAKGERDGIVGTYVPRRFHDLWGRPYRILLDTNRDNQVKNPAAASRDPKVSQNQAAHLAVQVAVYSSGMDGVAQTQDDLTSWR